MTFNDPYRQGGDTVRTPESAVEGNVLVAAEDRRIVSMFEAALGPAYNVWTATSGRQALDILDNDVDVVIVDEKTTDIGGTELVAKANRREIKFKTASVGYIDEDLFDSSVESPLTASNIRVTVDELVKTQKGADELIGEFGRPDGPVASEYMEWKDEATDGFGHQEFDYGNEI